MIKQRNLLAAAVIVGLTAGTVAYAKAKTETTQPVAKSEKEEKAAKSEKSEKTAAKGKKDKHGCDGPNGCGQEEMDNK